MAWENKAKQRGLEDLRWYSLSKAERVVIADLLERTTDIPAHVHLDNVVFELRSCSQLTVSTPMVFTPLQHRVVAETLEKQAAYQERNAQNFVDQPALERSAHYVAGYLRFLVHRLVKGESPEKEREVGRKHLLELLLLHASPCCPLEHEDEKLELLIVEATNQQLDLLGLKDIFLPAMESIAPSAIQNWKSRLSPVVVTNDTAFDLEIVDSNAERLHLAQSVFDCAMEQLSRQETPWGDFVARLTKGEISGCQSAREYPGTAQKAATVAYTLACALHRHLETMADASWAAVSPGMKSIIDGYPSLKKRRSLKSFIRCEVGRHYKIRMQAINPSISLKSPAESSTNTEDNQEENNQEKKDAISQ